MKKLYLILSLLSNLSLLAQIPNFSFENWGPNPDEPTTQAPVGWIVNNNTDNTDFVQQVGTSTDGSYSARLNIRLIGGSLKYGGQILTAFPYTGRPAKLSFYYQMKMGTGSTASRVDAQVILYNSGQSNNATGANLGNISTNSSAWTYKELPINYNQSGTPDSALINFRLVAGSDTTAYFILDELRFSSAATDVDGVSAASFGVRYLENIRAIEVIADGDIKDCTFSLYNIAGQAILCGATPAGTGRWILETGSLNSGVYCVNIRSSDHQSSSKLYIR
jgi:hypothetical protein